MQVAHGQDLESAATGPGIAQAVHDPHRTSEQVSLPGRERLQPPSLQRR